MTKKEVVVKAKSVADTEGWPWLLPIFAQVQRKGIFFGARYREVRTNCPSRGKNVEIAVDDFSGECWAKISQLAKQNGNVTHFPATLKLSARTAVLETHPPSDRK